MEIARFSNTISGFNLYGKRLNNGSWLTGLKNITDKNIQITKLIVYNNSVKNFNVNLFIV